MLDCHDVTMLEELQLRRWARLNYQPAESRLSLHEIVREEMARMDAENNVATDAVRRIHEQNRGEDNQSDIGSRFVPLAEGIVRLDAPVSADAPVSGPQRLPGGRFAELPASEL